MQFHPRQTTAHGTDMKRLHVLAPLILTLALTGCGTTFDLHVVPIQPPQLEDQVSVAVLWFTGDLTLDTLLTDLAAQNDTRVRVPEAPEGLRARLKAIDVAGEEHTLRKLTSDTRVKLEWPFASATPDAPPTAFVKYVSPTEGLHLYNMKFPENVTEAYFVVLDPGKAYDEGKRGDWLLQFYPTCTSESTDIHYTTIEQDRHVIITVHPVDGGQRELEVDIQAPTNDRMRAKQDAKKLSESPATE